MSLTREAEQEQVSYKLLADVAFEELKDILGAEISKEYGAELDVEINKVNLGVSKASAILDGKLDFAKKFMSVLDYSKPLPADKEIGEMIKKAFDTTDFTQDELAMIKACETLVSSMMQMKEIGGKIFGFTENLAKQEILNSGSVLQESITNHLKSIVKNPEDAVGIAKSATEKFLKDYLETKNRYDLSKSVGIDVLEDLSKVEVNADLNVHLQSMKINALFNDYVSNIDMKYSKIHDKLSDQLFKNIENVLVKSEPLIEVIMDSSGIDASPLKSNPKDEISKFIRLALDESSSTIMQLKKKAEFFVVAGFKTNDLEFSAKALKGQVVIENEIKHMLFYLMDSVIELQKKKYRPEEMTSINFDELKNNIYRHFMSHIQMLSLKNSIKEMAEQAELSKNVNALKVEVLKNPRNSELMLAKADKYKAQALKFEKRSMGLEPYSPTSPKSSFAPREFFDAAEQKSNVDSRPASPSITRVSADGMFGPSPAPEVVLDDAKPETKSLAR